MAKKGFYSVLFDIVKYAVTAILGYLANYVF